MNRQDGELARQRPNAAIDAPARDNGVNDEVKRKKGRPKKDDNKVTKEGAFMKSFVNHVGME